MSGSSLGRRTDRLQSARVQVLEPRRLLSASDPDPTYGAGGVGLLPYVGDTEDYARAIAVRADGRFVVASEPFGSADTAAFLYQFLPTGQPDTSFGTAGMVRVPRAAMASVDELSVNPDGTLLAASLLFSAPVAPVVRRFAVNGTLDPAWSVPAAAVSGTLRDLAPLGDGRAYLVSTGRASLVRSDGSLDTSFAGTGFVDAPKVSSTNYVSFRAGAAAAGGGVLLLANHLTHSPSNTGVVQVRRYTAAGQPDASYGAAGVVTPPGVTIGTGNERIAVDRAGRGVVVGSSSGGTRIVRLTAAGAADNTFDGDGVRSVDDFGTDAGIINLGIDSADRIVLAGVRSVGGVNPTLHYVARLTDGGARDTTFAGDGVLDQVLPSPWLPYLGQASVVLPDDTVLLAAAAYPTATAPQDVAVVHLSAAGAFDSAFGAGGVVRQGNRDSRAFRADTAALAPDGKLVVPGYDSANAGIIRVARFAAGGSPDAAFGTAGLAPADLGGRSHFAFDTAVQPDGKVVVAGRRDLFDFATNTWLYAPFVARLTAAGAPDPTFNGTGMVAPDFSREFWSTTHAALDGTGNVVTLDIRGGSSGFPRRLVLTRRLPDGQPDSSFGSGGEVELARGGWDITSVTGLFTAPDGGVVVTGRWEDSASTTNPPPDGAFILRLTTEGQPDSGHGTDGWVMAEDHPNTTWPGATTDADGRIYLWGNTSPGLAVARYTPAGLPDETFAPGGRRTVALPTTTFGTLTWQHLSAAADGRLLVSGYKTRRVFVNGNSVDDRDYAVARLRADGTLDTGFGTGGVAAIDRGSRSERLHWGAALPDGRLVFAGTTTTVDGVYAVASVRLLGDHDATPPAVTASTFVYAAGPHAVRVTFSEDVGASLAAGDLSVVDRGTDAAVPAAAMSLSYDTSTRTATWTFPGLPVGRLANGNYRATLTGVTDPAGNAAPPHTLDFYQLAGDANRDRVVSGADLSVLLSNYGKGGRTWASGDLDGDGTVGGPDLSLLLSSYGKAVPVPGSVPPTPSAVAGTGSARTVTTALARPPASRTLIERRATTKKDSGSTIPPALNSSPADRRAVTPPEEQRPGAREAGK